ncbi:MAG: SGNH/GDSL hydrolase family protein [Flavobacteriales bacterium]
MKTLKKLYKYVMVIAILGVVVSCEKDFDNEVSDVINSQNGNSTADFTRFVALGNSLTAGTTDGTVFKSSQENSYPAMLAKRFKEAQPNMEPFNIPYVKDEVGGLKVLGVQVAGKRMRFVLGTKSVTYDTGETLTDVTAGIGGTAYGNLGVPGARAAHLLYNGYGNILNLATTANPYYVYFASSPTTTVLADAMAQNPTFFTLWIGNNDVLGYATTGGDEGGDVITDQASFEGYLNTMITTLSANAKGVVANIPYVTSIPYFTTVPYNAIPLDQATADTANQAYAAYNAGLDGLVGNLGFTQEEADRRKISFKAGQNAVVIIDSRLTDLTGVNSALVSMRQATAEDLFVLTSQTKIGTLANASNPSSVIGVGVPLGGEYVLTKEEVADVTAAVNGYNETLTNLANSNNNVVLADMNKKLQELADTGLIYDGISYSDTYVSGNAFSLDGIHPTAKGYAIVANEFIKVINENFGTQLLEYNPNDYQGIGLQ